MVWVVLGICVCVTLTILNILFARNIKSYSDFLRRGMVRTKVWLEFGDKKEVISGWSYQVELNAIMSNPVSRSSSFVKVYVRGNEAVSVSFANVKKLKVLNDNYLSVVLAKRSYL